MVSSECKRALMIKVQVERGNLITIIILTPCYDEKKKKKGPKPPCDLHSINLIYLRDLLQREFRGGDI